MVEIRYPNAQPTPKQLQLLADLYEYQEYTKPATRLEASQMIDARLDELTHAWGCMTDSEQYGD